MQFCFFYLTIKFKALVYGDGDWGLGIGDLGFGVWAQFPSPTPPPPTPQPQTPNPQSPIPNPHLLYVKLS